MKIKGIVNATGSFPKKGNFYVKNLESVFWKKTIRKIVHECKSLYKLARKNLTKLDESNGLLLGILDRSMAPILDAEAERAKVMKMVGFIRDSG